MWSHQNPSALLCVTLDTQHQWGRSESGYLSKLLHFLRSWLQTKQWAQDNSQVPLHTIMSHLQALWEGGWFSKRLTVLFTGVGLMLELAGFPTPGQTHFSKDMFATMSSNSFQHWGGGALWEVCRNLSTFDIDPMGNPFLPRPNWYQHNSM